jgi:hypothetical protein
MQELVDPWERYEKLLRSARSIKTSEPRIVDIHQIDGNMYCTQLWTINLVEPSRIKRWINSWNPSFSINKSLGFSKEDEKQRMCIEPNCYYVSRSIFDIVNHLHFAHRIAISEVGKLLPAIRNDNRIIPKYRERFRMTWKIRIEGLKEFFNNRE